MSQLNSTSDNTIPLMMLYCLHKGEYSLPVDNRKAILKFTLGLIIRSICQLKLPGIASPSMLFGTVEKLAKRNVFSFGVFWIAKVHCMFKKL